MNQAAAAAVMPGELELGLIVVGGLLSLVALICGIIVVVRMFQNQKTALGMISLTLMFCSGVGHLVALVVGWMKSSEWNIKGLMVAYTLAFFLGTVLLGSGYGIWTVRVVKEFQNSPEMQQWKSFELQIEQ